MPGGFIQLLATGKESEYLNDVPQISFFKCYFRRHTNFFMNNIEIFSNYYEQNGYNTVNIPKSGDLLSKGYLKLNFNENYIEILNNYENLASTLTIDITTFYDSYNIYINQYNKNNISDIQIPKFIFTNSNIKYLNFMSTYITNGADLILKIKFDSNITLQTDKTNIFYNINLPYLYYGFLYSADYKTVLNTINETNNLLNLLTANINYSTMRYFRLDLANLNIAFKFTFDNYKLYQYLFDYCVQTLDSSSTNIIKINQYDIYVSLKFNLSNSNGIELLIKLVNIIKNLFVDYTSIQARYYNNKIKYSDILIKKNEINNFVNNIFGKEYTNISQNTKNKQNTKTVQSLQTTSNNNLNYLYYNIIFPSTTTLFNESTYIPVPNNIQMDIFNLKESIFFGNLDTNDFNQTLISNETSLLNSSNINSTYSICLNTYIRLIVTLFCVNNYNPTIQEFLNIINSPTKIINLFYSNYTNNIDKFNKKILDTIIYNNVLFLNRSSIRSIIYQNETFNHYNKITKQFVSKRISNYESTIINNYIFKNILENINSSYYCTFDMLRILIENIILANYTTLNTTEIITLNYYYNNIINYENNNNVFDFIIFDYFSNFKNNQIVSLFNVVDKIYRNFESFLYYVIYLVKLLINSNIPIENIYNKNSNVIYFSSGITQQVVSEVPLNNIIFPLTSSFFFYTYNTISNSNNKNNYNLYYNTEKETYNKNIKNAMYQMYVQNYQKYNSNLNNYNPRDFSDVYDYFNQIYVEITIQKYYSNIQNYLNSQDYILINNYFSNINYNNCKLIYNCDIDIDNLLLFYLFQYADSSLFNNAFSDYDITYPKTNNFYFTNNNTNNYLKFIFLPSSPYYRIFYLYNFLTTMSVDTELLNQMPNDLVKLRDLLLQILINIININLPSTIFNNFNENVNYNFSNFNTDIFFTFNVFINNVFMCYDNINILFKEEIKKILNNSGLEKQIYIYCPFYFCKNNVNIIQNNINNSNVNFNGIFANNGFNILNLLSNIYNNVKYNFDDTIINALLITLKYNQDLFIDINNVISFVNSFYDKKNNNFTTSINILNSILNSKNQYDNIDINYDSSKFITNTYYKNCYYTSYSIGALFDNINQLTINTINNLYSITNQLTNIDIFSLFYKNKTFDVKQYQNILLSKELIDGFMYYKNLLFNINISTGVTALQYFQDVINGITKYIFDNFSYLINYLVSDYVFKDLLLAIDNYTQLYNSKNNSNIDLYNYFNTLLNINIKSIHNNFQTNNIIIVYLLYFLFAVTCLSSDIINFIEFETKNINNGSSFEQETFDSYVKSLYTENIYLNCLESFISILNNSTETLIFNYSTIYVQNITNGFNINNNSYEKNNIYTFIQPSLYSIILNQITSINNNNYYENKLLNYTSDDYTIPINKVFINQYNINDVVSWFQLNINYSSSLAQIYLTTKQLSFNVPFYNRYRNTINAILNENEKLLFTINNKYFVNFISNNKLVSNDLFTSYQQYINTNYEKTLTIIKNMYSNLKLSFQANDSTYYVEYQNLLIEQIFALISKFYDTSINNTNTYTHTLLFSNTNILLNNVSQIGEIINANNLYNITKYEASVQDFTLLRDFFIRYLNTRITSSINVERNINRFIYNYVNQYILKMNKYSEYVIEYMKNNTLYDYVKLYNNINSNSSNIEYESNLALYQNDIVFEILNYLNYSDKKCFIQNPIFNDFIVNFSLYPPDKNSFYKNFKRFIHFLKDNNNSNLFNKFILKNGINVIQYFLDLFNLDEFHNYIYSFINLTEAFSPISIYDDIVNIKNNHHQNSFSSKLNIDFDNIMKKIVIYLYVIYLINANLFNIINDNIIPKILKNYTLEYNFPKDQIKVNLNNVFDDNFYTKLKKYIYYITVFDSNYPSIYKITNYNFEDESESEHHKTHHNNTFFEIESEFCDPAYFYDIKNNTNAKDFLNLCYKYVTSYEKTIGFNNINTLSLIVQSEPTDITISKLVQSYNVLLNIDQSSNNPNNYFLTNAISIILNMYYDTIIMNINNICNIENNLSQFIFNTNKYYTNTQIKNTNLLLILLVYLLSKFNISYIELTNNLDNIIANFRIGTFNLSEIFEELKGYTSDSYIKNNTINFAQTKNLIGTIDNEQLTQNSATILSRSQNITDLSVLISTTNNYSNIMPIDYDYDVINFNMGSIYNKGIDIYKKYYSYQYNFYKFEDNYTKIYSAKYKYYTDIIGSDYALLNIKNYNYSFFNKLVINIIYTLLSQPYFNYNGDNSIFEPSFNQLIKFYMKYYFTFRLNPEISNVENLQLQKSFRSIANTTMTLDQIYLFINQLYFYELYGIIYTSFNTGTSRDNYNYFMQQIELQGNYNFEYVNYVYNFAFYLENSIIIINWYLAKYFSINTNNNFIIVKNFINDFIDEISSFSNISEYFNNSYLYYNSSTNPFIYNLVVNTINYTDFIERFSKVIKQIIYCTENISFANNITNAYDMYFKDVIFYYKKYIENSSIILTYTINLNQLQQYTYSYLIYMLSNKTNLNISKLYVIFSNIMTTTLQNLKINELHILYNWIFNTKNNYKTSNEYIDNIVTGLYKLLNTNYWGIVYSYYDKYYLNTDLDFKILLINYSSMILNNPNLTVEYIVNINYKLEILYKLKIFYIIINNISDYVFQNYFLYILTNCYQYIFNDDIFYCVNLENDICTYLDFINKNIIKDNKISNYYKNIQNKSIRQIVNYGINSFYNYNANNDFLANIYNAIITTLLEQDETTIASIFVENSILNILNQYDDTVYNYSILKSDIQYIDKTFDTIINKISEYLDIIKSIFGGTNKNNTEIKVSVYQLVNIFSNKNYKYDKNIITIFTLIYDNFNNLGIERINYNMLITLFYYICMIIYILNKWDKIFNQYLFNSGQSIIYELINYINIQIYDYINSVDKLKSNIFFNGLNELLVNVYDNEMFTQKIIIFFDNVLNIQQIYKDDSFKKIQLNMSLKGFTGANSTIDIEYINNLLYKKYVVNNKILIWKNMLVNIVDANLSQPIYNMKSMMYDTLFDIPTDWMQQITINSGGLYSNNGMINLLEELQLYISDELIDRISNQMLIIIKDLMTNLNVLDGLNQMLGIGNTDDFIKPGPIKPYILQVYKKSLYLPLNFFFKDRMNAIPLISCMYSDIMIRIKNSRNNLIKNFYINEPLLLTNKQINTSTLFDFILLERSERKRLTLNKQDNLIEKHNYYSISKTIDSQYSSTDNFIYLDFDFNINGLIKEMFWTIDFFVNGYLIEDQQYKGRSINNMILSTVFYIDGIRRDGIYPLSSKNIIPNINTTNNNSPNPNNPGDYIVNSNNNYNKISELINQSRHNARIDNNNSTIDMNLDNIIYIDGIQKDKTINTNNNNLSYSNNITTYNYNAITRLINQYKYNTRADPNNNINVYSFAFEPEKFQPTGSINMDMYNSFRIQLILDKNKFLQYFGSFNNITNLDTIMITMNLSTLEYNLLRYQSGLAGLLFMK